MFWCVYEVKPTSRQNAELRSKGWKYFNKPNQIIPCAKEKEHNLLQWRRGHERHWDLSAVDYATLVLFQECSSNTKSKKNGVKNENNKKPRLARVKGSIRNKFGFLHRTMKRQIPQKSSRLNNEKMNLRRFRLRSTLGLWIILTTFTESNDCNAFLICMQRHYFWIKWTTKIQHKHFVLFV